MVPQLERKSRRELAGSFAALSAATLAGQVLGFIALSYVARRLGPQSLGAYNLANNIAWYFTLPLMPGISLLGIRELSTATAARRRGVVDSVQMALLLNGCLAFAALWAVAPMLSPNPLTHKLLVLTGFTLVVAPLGLDWAMQGMQQARLLGLFRLTGQIVYFALVFAVLGHGPSGVEEYAVWNVLGVLATSALTVVYVRVRLRRSANTSPGGSSEAVGAASWWPRFKTRLTLGASIVMIQVYYYADTIIIGYLRGERDVGLYSTASRLPIALSGLASLWVTVFYPHAARASQSSKQELVEDVGHFSSLGFAFALPAAVGAIVVAHPLVDTLFGRSFGPGSSAFAILMAAAGVSLVNATVAQVLLARGDDRAFMRCVAAGAAVNVALNFALVPTLGISGAAVATLVAEVLILALAWLRFSETLGRIPLELQLIGRAGGATVILTGLALGGRSAGEWWLGAVLGAICYVAVVWGRGAFGLR